MTKLEAILRETRTLSPAELARLLAGLMEQAGGNAYADEAAAGQRGLAAWTESTRAEDWAGRPAPPQ
jgi:hypothetical protein